MEHFLTVNAGWLAPLAAVVTITWIAWQWGRDVLRWMRQLRLPKLRRRGRATIAVVEHPARTWWHMGAMRNEPAMQIVGRWYVTNITTSDVRVLAARLRRRSPTGMVATRDIESNRLGRVSIPPGDTSEVSVDFWVQPPVRREGEEFRATVVLIDQFGNEHEVRNVVFKYT